MKTEEIESVSDEELEKTRAFLEDDADRGDECVLESRHVRAIIARLKRAEAERDRLRDTHFVVNTWGAKLIEGMGAFMKQAVESNGPLTTKILCTFADRPEFPILHLWATTDGQDPVARNGELRQQLTERGAEIATLAAQRDAERAIATAAKAYVAAWNVWVDRYSTHDQREFEALHTAEDVAWNVLAAAVNKEAT